MCSHPCSQLRSLPPTLCLTWLAPSPASATCTSVSHPHNPYIPGPANPNLLPSLFSSSRSHNPFCPSCHLFSFARVRISPVPSPHPPEPSSQGPRPPPGSPSPGHPVQHPLLSLVRSPQLPFSAPPPGLIFILSYPTPVLLRPPSAPLQKGQSVLASATVAPGPHNGARPTRPMAAAIGKESRANAFSGWNSRTSPAGPAGPERLIWGLPRAEASGRSSYVLSARLR